MQKVHVATSLQLCILAVSSTEIITVLSPKIDCIGQVQILI